MAPATLPVASTPTVPAMKRRTLLPRRHLIQPRMRRFGRAPGALDEPGLRACGRQDSRGIPCMLRSLCLPHPRTSSSAALFVDEIVERAAEAARALYPDGD